MPDNHVDYGDVCQSQTRYVSGKTRSRRQLQKESRVDYRDVCQLQNQHTEHWTYRGRHFFCKTNPPLIAAVIHPVSKELTATTRLASLRPVPRSEKTCDRLPGLSYSANAEVQTPKCTAPCVWESSRRCSRTLRKEIKLSEISASQLFLQSPNVPGSSPHGCRQSNLGASIKSQTK